jgi:signal transduction histidine kinase
VRRRLVVATVALVVATVLAFALPLAVAVERLLESRALDGLQGGVERLGLLLDVTSRDCAELQLRVAQLADGPGVVSVVGLGGVLVATTAETPAIRLGDELRVAVDGRPGRRASDGELAVALPLSTTVCGRQLVLHATSSDAELARSVTSAWLGIAAVAVAVAGVAAGTAAWLAGRLARPLEALAVAARRLGEGDFSVRAPRSGLAEADGIAEALDGTAARLGRAVERSAAFTGDASHQLRTPLTALRLHLEALEAAGADPAAVAAALGEADRLEATIEDLTTLTRVDVPEVDVDVAALVRERLPSWEASARDLGRDVRLELLPVPIVQARPAALTQAVAVLVDNALRHGAGAITVRVAPARPDEPNGVVRVCVADEGSVGEVADRPGGRGLPLARALIAAEGGRLTVDVGDEGTSVCLVLPGRDRGADDVRRAGVGDAPGAGVGDAPGAGDGDAQGAGVAGRT